MPPAFGRVSSMPSALCSIIARKRFSLRCIARSRRARPHAARAISASTAAEVSSVRKPTNQASSRHGASTAASVAPAATKSGKPRTAAAETSTRSLITGLVVQASKRPSPRTARAISSL